MLTASSEATQALKTVMEEKNIDSPVRVFAQQGCGGAQLALGIDQARDDDHLSEIDGITFVVAKDLSEQVGAISLDYVSDATQPGFTLQSEKPLPSGGGCGCGCSC